MSIIAYGYRRTKQPFLDAGANTVWLDDRDDRPELQAMLATPGAALRPGDTLLVHTVRDFGRWARRVRALADRDDITIKVLGVAKKAARGPGRPAVISPTPDEAAALRSLWEGPSGLARIEVEAAKILGHPARWWNVRDFCARQRP